MYTEELGKEEAMTGEEKGQRVEPDP